MSVSGYKQMVRSFKAQAQISADGKSVALAGYTARRRDEPAHFFGLTHEWEITAPPRSRPDAAPALSGNRIVPDGGCFSRRYAIEIMARCAAREALNHTR